MIISRVVVVISEVVAELAFRMKLSGTRNFFFYACSGQRQCSTVSFSGFGLWVRVKVLGSVYHNRFPNSNPNLIHNSSRNLS